MLNVYIRQGRWGMAMADLEAETIPVMFGAVEHAEAPEEEAPVAAPAPPPVVDETPVVQEPVEEGSSNLMLILGFVAIIAMSLLLPAAIAFYAAEDELGAAFRFGDVFALVRDNFTTYLILAIVSWAVYTVGGILGIIVCGLGWLFTIPYAELVIGHLTGQAYAGAQGAAPAILDES